MNEYNKYSVDFQYPIDEESLAWKLHLYIGAAITGQHREMQKLYPQDTEGKAFFEEGLRNFRRDHILRTYKEDPEDTLG